MVDKATFEVEFIVGPFGEDAISVYFEPTGMMYRVEAGEHLRVRISGLKPGYPDLQIGQSDLVIWGWPESAMQVWDKTGCELDI
ncbi:hypothetical protein ABIA39_002034 [Nocardia sp. GAS34]|uniref:hypothetical protein n=1 Tax=unclassified Nocardia TaxID=2637762 RepID=UPI003D1FB5F1